MAFDGTLDLIDLIDIFREFHPKAAEYTYFSSAHRMFSGMDHMLGCKTRFINLRRFKSYKASSLTVML